MTVISDIWAFTLEERPRQHAHVDGRCAMVLAFVIGSTAVVNAQSDAAASFAPLGPFVFLAEDSLKPDRSYLFQHTDGDLVFEAQIAPDIMIVDHSSG